MRNDCGIDGAALDRWITGNYGEDQYKGCEICESCEHFADDDCGKDPSECEAEAKESAIERKAEELRDRRAEMGVGDIE
jgi:hypothetical protein